MSNTKNTTTTPKIANRADSTSTKPVALPVVHPTTTERNQAWLEAQLEHIWQTHFHDVARLNTVTIKWSRANRTRLGTITARAKTPWQRAPEVSEIRVNPLLKHPEVPLHVVWQTIAHELAHYTHGFCSPHARKYSHPHRGNVIQKELYARDMVAIYDEAEVWLKQHWRNHVVANMAPVKRTKRRTYARKRTQVSLLSHLQRAIKRRRGV